MSLPSSASSRPRVLGLDAARALAVLAMVFGHTLDAVLSPEARQVPWVRAYWLFRSLTAPLFLFVSGCVLLLVLERRRLVGRQVVRAFLPRVSVLFALGYALRLPIWDLRGLVTFEPSVWRYFATFDALQCIAASMSLALCLSALVKGPLGRGVLMLTAAAGLILAAPKVWSALSEATAPGVLQQTFGGGEALFTLFPWGAYFLLGACVGCVFSVVPSDGRRALLLLGAAALIGLLLHTGEVLSLPQTDARKILWRLGPVMALVAFAFLLPTAVAHRLAPLGRASLWVYVIHLPIAYGWGFWHGLSARVGQTLSDVDAIQVAGAVLLFSGLAAMGAQHAYRQVRQREGTSPEAVSSGRSPL